MAAPFQPHVNSAGGFWSPGHNGDQGARWRMVAAKEADPGLTYEQLAAQFGNGCCASTAWRACQAYQACGHVNFLPRGPAPGTCTALGFLDRLALELLVHRFPLLTLDQYRRVLSARYGVDVSNSTVDTTLAELDLTLKRRTDIHKERNSPRNIRKIHVFLLVQSVLKGANVVTVDETGFCVGDMGRNYGRCPSGQPLLVPGLRRNEGTRCEAPPFARAAAAARCCLLGASYSAFSGEAPRLPAGRRALFRAQAPLCSRPAAAALPDRTRARILGAAQRPTWRAPALPPQVQLHLRL